MNTPRQRVENRVNKVLYDLRLLAKCSKHRDILTQQEIDNIRDTIYAEVEATINALNQCRDAEPFKL